MMSVFIGLLMALTVAVMMPRYRNIRVRMKGGKTRIQRALVLKSGKLRFVKGKTRKKRSTRRKKRRSGKRKKKVRTRRRKTRRKKRRTKVRRTRRRSRRRSRRRRSRPGIQIG